MADTLELLLSGVANYSNFYSVLTVLLCFIIMVVFILRLNGENLLPTSRSPPRSFAFEQPMVGLENPFAVHLTKEEVSSLKGGVHIQVSTLRPCHTQVLWGVDTEAVPKELQLPASTMLDRLHTGTILEGAAISREKIEFIGKLAIKRTFHFPTPRDLTEEKLGNPPRKFYPLVIVAGVDSCSEESSPPNIVVQFTVIHLRDSVCTLDSHIVYQFLKTNDNQTYSLQPIFMATSDFSGSSSSSRRGSSEQTNMDSNPCDSVDERRSYSDKRTTGAGNETKTLNQSATTNFEPNTCDQTGSVGTVTPKNLKLKSHEQTSSSSTTTSTLMGNSDSRQTEYASESGADDNVETNLDSTVRNVPNISTGYVEEISTGTTKSLFGNHKDCIVCQNASIVFTLLPCRHACVCTRCFKLVDRCPMCRGYIDSYFRLKDRSSGDSSSDDDTDLNTDRYAGLNRWQALNQRLNEFLGFA